MFSCKCQTYVVRIIKLLCMHTKYMIDFSVKYLNNKNVLKLQNLFDKHSENWRDIFVEINGAYSFLKLYCNFFPN